MKMGIENILTKTNIQNILVVDAKENNITAAKNYFNTLKQYGINTEYSKNENDALNKLETQKFDFVIVDKDLNEKNAGIKVLKEVYDNNSEGMIITEFAPKDRNQTLVDSIYSLREYSGMKDQEDTWKETFEFTVNKMLNSKIYKNRKKLLQNLNSTPNDSKIINKIEEINNIIKNNINYYTREIYNIINK